MLRVVLNSVDDECTLNSNFVQSTKMPAIFRYIVWRARGDEPSTVSVRSLLSQFPDVKILKSRDSDYAVVLMDLETEKKIRQSFPELFIEEDVRYRVVSAR